MMGEHSRVGIELATLIVLKPQADLHMEPAPELEGQARVGRLLQGGPLETDMPPGLAREHAGQALPESVLGQGMFDSSTSARRRG